MLVSLDSLAQDTTRVCFSDQELTRLCGSHGARHLSLLELTLRNWKLWSLTICISTTALTHRPLPVSNEGKYLYSKAISDCGLDQPWDIFQQRITRITGSQPYDLWKMNLPALGRPQFSCPSKMSIRSLAEYCFCLLKHIPLTNPHMFACFFLWGKKKKKTPHPRSKCAPASVWSQKDASASIHCGRHKYWVIIESSGKSNFVVFWTDCIHLGLVNTLSRSMGVSCMALFFLLHS